MFIIFKLKSDVVLRFNAKGLIFVDIIIINRIKLILGCF